MKATSSFIGWLILCRHFWHYHRRLQKAKWIAHERKAWYQSERERLKFEQETAQLIPASDVRREFAIWAKAVVQVLETLPDILERDCGLQPAAVSRVQSIIDDLRDQIALRVTEAGADDEEELQQEE